MKNYAVMGFYESSGQIYCDELKAQSPEEALNIVARGIPIESQDDLQLVGAVESPYQGECALAGNAVVSAADYLGCDD